jgi:hypothetical protein
MLIAVASCGGDHEVSVADSAGPDLEATAPPDFVAPKAVDSPPPGQLVAGVESDIRPKVSTVEGAERNGSSDTQPVIRFQDDTLGVSYEVPTGWRVVRHSKTGLEVTAGPTKDGFASNIVVMLYPWESSPSELADELVKSGGGSSMKMSEVSREKFVTGTGLAGVRLVAIGTGEKHAIRSAVYCFPYKEKSLLAVTCTVHADCGSDFDSTFDKAMKSLQGRK